MADHIQWGNVVLYLDNETFRKGFLDARGWYFEDVYGEDGRAPEEPQRVQSMTSEELVRLVILPDEQGVYRFDEMGNEHLPAYLGYLFGYMSGPLVPETPEERQTREHSRVRIAEALTLQQV